MDVLERTEKLDKGTEETSGRHMIPSHTVPPHESDGNDDYGVGGESQ